MQRSGEVSVSVPSSPASNASAASAGGTTSAGSDGRPAGQTGTLRVKRGMADMLKGGVIMDVVTPEQAKIAEDAGAVAGMALDYIDESEVLTPADEAHHVDKWDFTVPFVCGATNLGEALRRIAEGAAMIRSKGEAGTGNVVEATRHMRGIRAEIRRLSTLSADELYRAAKDLQAPYDLVAEVAAAGKLAVVLFTAGGLATPADAAMMMQLGADGVFVGSGIFKSGDPAARAAAI